MLDTAFTILFIYQQRLSFAAAWFNLLEEIIAFIINKDKCREINNINLPDSFHTKFWIFKALDALDIVLSQDSCRTADTTEIEATVFLARFCNNICTVTFGQHYHTATMTLEEVDIRIHTIGSCRAH